MLCTILICTTFVNATIRPADIKTYQEEDITTTSTLQPEKIGSLTKADNALSFQTKEFLTSNADQVFYDENTKEFSIKSADVLILKDLDAVQLQDARLRNRVLTMQGAGSVHLKDPIPIDLDEIGPSTFWFEGNDLRAMEITFPKDKSYTLNNPLSHDASKFYDIEHMLDSDKDGITDEVERLRNLNPFSKDTDNDGLDDSTELLKWLTDPVQKVSDLISGLKQKFFSDSEIMGFVSQNTDKFSGDVGNAIRTLGLKDNLLRDSDGDGISDILEKTQYNTDPFKYDTDGDGYGDGYEVTHGLDLNEKDPLRSELLNFNTCNDCKIAFGGKAGDKFFLDLKDYKGNQLGSKLNIKLTNAQFSILEGNLETGDINKQNALKPLKTIGDLILTKESNGYEISSNGNEDRITTYGIDEIIRGDHITNVDLEKDFTYAVIQDGDYVINIKLNECFEKGDLNPENDADVQVDFSNDASNLKSEQVFIFKDDETVRKVKDFVARNNIRYAYLNNLLNKVKNIINFDLLSKDLNTEVYLTPELTYYIKDKGRFNKFNERFVIVG